MPGDQAPIIVIVESDAAVRALVEAALSPAGYRVIGVPDSAGALEVLTSEPPDLLLLDFALPAKDGSALLDTLASGAGMFRPPVIFLVGPRDLVHSVPVLGDSNVDYLAKPLTREALLQRVGEALGRHERRGPTTQAKTAPEGGTDAGPPRSSSFESIPAALRDVLVVEDDPVFRGFLRDVLAGRGLTVHEAENGSQGLRLALECRPWLILTEVAMVGGDGFELCRQVRGHSLLRQTPLVFLSATGDYKYRSHALWLGADDFLPKDTPIRELLMRVLLLLERRVGLGVGGSGGWAMAGQISIIGSPGMLQVCHLMQLSGVLVAQDGPRGASVRFREGEIVGAEVDGESAAAAVTALLAWERGSFEFHPGDPGPGAPLVESFTKLLLEGCRTLDESRRS